MIEQDQSHCAKDASCDQEAGFDPSCFHIVALGASAGGLESLERFFKAMPPRSGMAFVIIQHLSPDFRSLMDELLARHTSMQIVKAQDDMPVEPNTIYLNPPRKNMIISGGNLYLSDVDANESLTLPIDQFFRSLAQDYRRQAIAVVLSGTGSDGSRGVRNIFEAGGLVVAETEETAKFDGMPRSAQETGCVHLVLPPDAMAEALVSYVNQALSPQDFAEKVFVPPRLGGMETVFRLLKNEYGLDFSYYKPNTVIRRIERRAALMAADSIEAYVKKLEQDSEELNSLYRDLLIGVTRFFRDPDAFTYLRDEAIPELIEDKQTGDELRVWIAGCATGEEAYSIAILIDEALKEANKNLDVKIFATDVHPVSLEFASNGIYVDESFAQVDDDRIEKYFRTMPDGYQVKSNIRQMVVFARHNVFKDAPFTKIDLISCRNLLIYLQPLAQKKALSLFHFGLRTRGLLMLGPSESPGELKDEFECRNNRWKIFRKRRDVRLPTEMRLPLSPQGTLSVQRPVASPAPNQQPAAPQRNLMRAYDKLLDHYVSAAFLIDAARNVLHVFGSAKDYLEPRSGRLSTDLLEMVRPDLKPILASAIQRVRRVAEPQVTTAVRLEVGDQVRDLKIHVARLVDEAAADPWFVVSLDERSLPVQNDFEGENISASEISKDRVNNLEVELRYTKESLQTTVEELETSNEELQATNEELVASNEELQSTNEELHSVNEELYTVNAEYQNKIAELTELTADMDNLLESTEIGTIFLDEQLAIRKYTGKVEKWFDIVSRDVGRKISAFSNTLNHPNLIEDVESVLNQNKPLEREIQDRSGKWLHLRLHPYRRDDAAVGVVMTLIEISNLKQTRAKLQRLSAIVESSDDAIIGKSFSGVIESWNQAAEKLFGYSAEEAIGQDVSLILPEDVTDEAQAFFQQLRRGESADPIEVRRRIKSGKEIDIAVRFSPIRDESGQVVGMSAICRDISARKEAERELLKLAMVVRHTDNAVVITDANGLTEWVNEGFTRITGYTIDDVRGCKPGHVLQGPESDPATIATMREKVAAGQGFNVEIINYASNGKPYWMAIESRPILDDAGKVTGFMAIQSDVTELKNAKATADSEVARRDEFLAMLSHELRNPLGALRNGLEVLEYEGNEARSEIKSLLKSQVAQMSRLLDDLLDVSRITQDKVILRRTPFDLRVAAQEAAGAMKPLAQQRGCEIRVQLPDEELIVNGDSARLQQVQVNLLNNALKHSRPGDPVDLTLEKSGDNAVITVRDYGDGIEPEMQAKIFDLFFQVDSKLSTSESGLGVGLSLVREFVEMHDGYLVVQSDGPGKGAAFQVTLPVCVERPKVQERAPEETTTGLRIVVVEDQDENRFILKRMLELAGHTVADAATAKDGIELIRSERPDLALVDIGLPDMPGYEVARTLRRLNQVDGTFLAALTGFGQPSDVQKAHDAGFHVHLVKPLDLKKLKELMATIGSSDSAHGRPASPSSDGTSASKSPSRE